VPRILDVIEYFDQTGQEFVHRIPEDGGGDFRLGSQCIVRESQVAVFFRDGKALDTLGPGRHTLTTANIPLLVNLLSIPFSGNTPFKAEVYFVNMREFVDQKWGTPEPILFRDSELGMVRLRAFGSYSIQINNPALFVNKIVGTQGSYETSQINNYLRSIIVSNLNDLLGENMKSVLDLPALYDEIAAGTRAKVGDSFAQLGLDLKAMFVTSITPPEEVQKMIDQRTSLGVIGVGNMQAFMQMQAAQAMREAANRPGSGAGDVAALGLGLGAGAGMGAMMAGMMGQAIQQPQQQPPQYPPQQYPQQPPVQPQGIVPSAAPAQPIAPLMVACPSCQAQVPAGSRFCNNCGAQLGPRKCPNCQTEAPQGAKFCGNCGTKLA